MKDFGKKIDAFSQGDAILTGVETRTSSPIRIERDRNYSTIKYKNLRPIGEGAGYAGGIVSSALDGLKCAISILENKKYKNQSFFIKLKYKHEQSHQIITNVGAIFLIYINCQLLIKKKISLAYNLLYQ